MSEHRSASLLVYAERLSSAIPAIPEMPVLAWPAGRAAVFGDCSPVGSDVVFGDSDRRGCRVAEVDDGHPSALP